MRSILVIDANSELRNFVAEILVRAGHTVKQADDAEQAAPLLRSEPADLIVTDLLTSSRHRARTLATLRQEFPWLEIIAISDAPHSTGFLRLAATLAGRRTPANPFVSQKLMGLINEMITGVAAHRAHADYQATRQAVAV